MSNVIKELKETKKQKLPSQKSRNLLNASEIIAIVTKISDN